ncbi:hypothetical protein BJ322DRAFT_1104391 [Thelephora terrestris]|uniref:Uncharacterized protein n=1 Tax=Thelephora terrestris TaxID=56493 RepID=A0A9P6LB06_9AGAM|nr:hypothetical protein BJ322DRAFT_1104391 [Thelephora terrestris]
MKTNARPGKFLNRELSKSQLTSLRLVGQMEKTFLLTACRNANLQVLLKDEAVADTVGGLLNAFASFTGENRRGSRLSDLRNPGQRLKLVGNPRVIHLDERTHSALSSSVTSAENAPAQWVDFFASHRQKIKAYKKIIIHGVTFQTRHAAARDSYITFENGAEIWSGFIDQILLPEGSADIHSVLLSIETFSPLSLEDQQNDPYRLWGFAGGELFYDLFLETPLIIAPTQILGHIAKTSVGKVFGIERSCVHTLPLDQFMSDIEEAAQNDGVE